MRSRTTVALLGVLVAGAALADVRIISPEAVPAFGKVEFMAEVTDIPGVLRVELRVDGRIMASPTAPPYRALVDVGEDNRSHRFEVSVVTSSGIAARAASGPREGTETRR